MCAVKRGGCSFALKAQRCQAAGAVAVIVCNSVAKWPFVMDDSKGESAGLKLPVVMLRKDHGEALLQQASAPTGDGKPPEQQGEAKSGDGTQSTGECLVKIAPQDRDMSCVVCHCPFSKGDTCIRMPCLHIFHEQCILPWLKIRNSCPTCRHELPTESKAYEASRAERANRTDTASIWSVMVS